MMDSNFTRNNTGIGNCYTEEGDFSYNYTYNESYDSEHDEFYNLDDDDKVEIRRLAAHTNFTIVVLIFIIFAVGFVGNVIFLFSVIRVKALKTVTNFYLANVAVADLLFLNLETSNAIWQYKQKENPFTTSFECGLYYFAYHLSFFASILLLTLVTGERYFAICHPLKHLQWNNKKRSVFLTSITWFVAAIFANFVALKFGKLEKFCTIIHWPTLNSTNSTERTDTRKKEAIFDFKLDDIKQGNFTKNKLHFAFCSSIHPILHDVADIVQGIPFFVAAVMNAALYTKIIKRLYKPLPNRDVNNAQNQQSTKQKRQIAHMLLANYIIFFVCLTPGQLLNLQDLSFFEGGILLDYENEGPHETTFMYTVILLKVLNSAINPILYGLASPSYRRGFQKAFSITTSRVEPTEVVELNK